MNISLPVIIQLYQIYQSPIFQIFPHLECKCSVKDFLGVYYTSSSRMKLFSHALYPLIHFVLRSLKEVVLHLIYSSAKLNLGEERKEFEVLQIMHGGPEV